MERLTEYHNGVAVIRDKALLKDAMRKLAGYEDLEEQGLLLKLPCKVGTQVWTVMCGMTGKNPTLFRQDFELSMIQYWNKAVFLTKAEAEKALAEMEKKGD